MQGDTDAESSMHVADFKWFIESLVKVDLGGDAGGGISSGGGTVGGGGSGGSICGGIGIVVVSGDDMNIRVLAVITVTSSILLLFWEFYGRTHNNVECPTSCSHSDTLTRRAHARLRKEDWRLS